jgi:hypothetical protein
MAAGDQPPTPPLRPGIVLLAMVGWLGMVAWWIFHARTWLDQQTWEQTSASVDEVTYERGIYDRLSHSCSTGDGRGPRVVLTTYSYDVGGVRFSSKAYDHLHESELFCEEAPARARIAELKKRGQVTVFYDPDRPERAVQRRQEGSEVIFVLSLLAVAGVVLIVWWRRQKRRYREYERARRAFFES